MVTYSVSRKRILTLDMKVVPILCNNKLNIYCQDINVLSAACNSQSFELLKFLCEFRNRDQKIIQSLNMKHKNFETKLPLQTLIENENCDNEILQLFLGSFKTKINTTKIDWESTRKPSNLSLISIMEKELNVVIDSNEMVQLPSRKSPQIIECKTSQITNVEVNDIDSRDLKEDTELKLYHNLNNSTVCGVAAPPVEKAKDDENLISRLGSGKIENSVNNQNNSTSSQATQSNDPAADSDTISQYVHIDSEKQSESNSSPKKHHRGSTIGSKKKRGSRKDTKKPKHTYAGSSNGDKNKKNHGNLNSW